MGDSASVNYPDGPPQMQLEFVVDYLHPRGPLVNYAYDPGRNGVTTLTGFGGTTWSNASPSTMVDDGKFPVVTVPMPVICN